MKELLGRLKTENKGMGVVEVVLILVVIIALVVIFKDSIEVLVQGLLDSITKKANAL